MSIANEISRINGAKENMREAIEKRGVTVAHDALVDSYAEQIEKAPYATKGYFTPEVDTKVFSLSGLPFAPHTISIYCNELYSAGVNDSVILMSHGKGLRGVALLMNENKLVTSFLSPETGLAQWSEDGYIFNLSLSSSSTKDTWFKSGYTYEYYVTGGFSQ